MGYLAEDEAAYASLCQNDSTTSTPNNAGENEPIEQEVVSAVKENDVKSTETERIKASPLAKKIAKKQQVALNLIEGTGPGGRILRRDVEAYIEKNNTSSSASPSEKNSDIASPVAAVLSESDGIHIPHSKIRKSIAKNMVESLRTMAQSSVSVEIDVTALFEYRAALVEKAELLGTKITINDLLSFAAIKVIKKHPLMNAKFMENEMITYPFIHLSMAVAAEHGLTTPIVRNAEKMSLGELSKALSEIVERARENKLTADELVGGTFTITNMGIFPLDSFNPIINPPQTAIVGFGRAVDKPVVLDGEIAIRKMMFLSLTYDHRVFDGLGVGRILKDFKQLIENPDILLVS